MSKFKRLLLIIFFFTGFFLISEITYAHFGGMPIFKINGLYALPDIFDYTQEYAGLRDRAPMESYPIGSSIQYEIEPTYLPISASVVRESIFTWDFGDGTNIESGVYVLNKTHTYPEEGIFTLIVSMSSRSFERSDPQVIQVVPIVIGNPEIQEKEIDSHLVEDNDVPKKNTPIGARIGIVIMGLLTFVLIIIAIVKNRK